jgi:WD40 repeat protein/Tfp pilus assembly protein PilF/uncharacterized caspase-like protein
MTLMAQYRLTATVLLILLLSVGVVFPQKARPQKQVPESKQAKSLVDAGDKFIDERKWKEALTAYQSALQIDPKNANAYIGLGDAYMGLGKWKEALDAYKQAVALAPQSADAQYALGDAYNTMRMHGDAFAPLVKAIQLDPSFAEAHYGIGYAYLSGEQYEKSLIFLKRAIALRPDYDDAHYSLALAYLHLGNQKGLDEERKKLTGLNSALAKKLESEINKFSAAANEASVISPTPSAVASVAELENPLPSPRPTSTDPIGATKFEAALWESIKNSKDPEDFAYYLRKYPNGKFAELARLKLRPNSSRSLTRDRTVNSPAKSASQTELNQNSSQQRPELSVVVGHSVPISALAFRLDEQILASGDGTGAIKLWDVKTGEGLSVITEGSDLSVTTPAVGSLAFSPDGKLLAAAMVVTQEIEETPFHKSQTQIGIWDLASGRPVRTLSGLNIRVDKIAFSHDGKWLASGGASQIITLWDVASAKVIRTFTGSADVVNAIQFSVDGTEITSGNWASSLDVRNTSTGMLVRHIPGPTQFAGLTRPIPGIPQLAEVFRKGPIFNAAGNRFAIAAESKFDLLPSGPLFFAKGALQVREWPSMRTFREFKQENTWTTTLGFSSSGRFVASGNSDGEIRIWDVESGAELPAIKKGYSSDIITMSANNKMLAQVIEEGKSIRLWDTANETTVKNLSGHTDDINTVVFSPDSKILASGSDDKTIMLWDLQNGGVKILQGHTEAVGAIAFHPSGKWLASVADKIAYEGENDPDNIIRFWKVDDGSSMGSIPDPSIPLSLSFSPDGEKLAIGNYDGTIVLLETSSQKPAKSLKSTGNVVAVAFLNAEMMQSISLSNDDTTGQIDVWNVSTGQLLKTSRINENDTTNTEKMAVGVGTLPSLAISGQFYAMPVKGNGLSLFARTSFELDPFSQKELATLYLLEDNNWLVVTPDGLFDGSPAAWSRAIWLFNGNILDHEPVESFFNEFFHPGLLTDILAGKHPAAPANIANKDRRQAQLRLSVAGTQTSGPITTRDVTVKLEVSRAPAGARDIRLFRNGSLVKVWRGDVLKDQDSVVLDATLPIVAGENKLTAYAFNRDNIKSKDVSLTITGAETLKRKGVIYILSVGVNEYEDPKFNLRYAVADAQSFAAEIKARQTTLNNYGSVEFIQLNDREATKAGILKSLSDLTTKAKPEDAVMVYFAGHGTAQENRFYLVPHDLGSAESSLQTILDHSISDEELGRVFEGMDAGQTALVIDACNSGQALESEEKRRGPMNSKGLAQLAYEKGMYVLTAAQSYQAAKEASRLGHGYLTYVLVEEGLKTGIADTDPKDGQVLLREWLKYATARVPQLEQQELDLQESHGRSLDRIKFVESDSGSNRNLQHPRVFYRRELESRPLVVSIAPENLVATVDTGPRTSKGATNSDDNSTRGIPLGTATTPTITVEMIESKYNRGLVNEVINDSKVFLQRQPDNAKVNMMLGFALLSLQNEVEGFRYLDKGFLGGESVKFNVRRHRFVGPLLQDGSLEISLNRLSMRFGNETYSATFKQITDFEALSFGESGIGLFIQGRFENKNSKEEKKEFKLFAPTAVVRQVLQGLTMVPIVSCLDCNGWTMDTVRLFNHLRYIN